MSLKLMYITNDSTVAKIAEKAGVDRIFIDLEILGKEERQKNRNTVISRHCIEDIGKVKEVLEKAKLLVRINPIHPNSAGEINDVISHGADIVMLPMFRTAEEVEFFLHCVGGRAKTSLLLETGEAVANMDQILSLKGIDEVHIGLNDLHIAYHMKFMFELLADGTVERICNKCKEKGIPYGFGGVARLGEGELPAEHILAEHYRLGSGIVILSRSFCNTSVVRDPKEIERLFQTGVSRIREYEALLTTKEPDFYENNRRVVCEKIAQLAEKALPDRTAGQERKEPVGKRISIQELKDISCQLLLACQLPADQADLVAECLVEAEVHGVSTHGIALLPAYMNKLLTGSFNTRPCFSTLREGVAFSVVDADNAIGYVSAVHCMKLAIKHCRQTGIYTVFCRNSNTYGAAFYYPLLAAREGLIGITGCNSPAAMPVYGGRQRLLGTNPLAIAIPCGKANPILFDMSTSKVAKSKINEARRKHEQIPLGWALDEEGKPTTDPVEAIKGFMLPLEGYKGYGLAMMIDIMAGVLSGAAFLNKVGKFYSEDNQGMNVGQTFIALDPLQVYGEGFYELMDQYVETIRTSESREGAEISLPGDHKWNSRASSMKKGIALEAAAIEKLNQCMRDRAIGRCL